MNILPLSTSRNLARVYVGMTLSAPRQIYPMQTKSSRHRHPATKLIPYDPLPTYYCHTSPPPPIPCFAHVLLPLLEKTIHKANCCGSTISSTIRLVRPPKNKDERNRPLLLIYGVTVKKLAYVYITIITMLRRPNDHVLYRSCACDRTIGCPSLRW